MNRRRCAAHVFAIGLLAIAVSAANGQPPRVAPRPRTGPYDRPVLSPYTTLLGLEGRPLLREYYRRVRPELELRSAATRFSRSIQDLQTQVSQQRVLIQSPSSQIGPTGHGTYFLNHRGYFGVGRR